MRKQKGGVTALEEDDFILVPKALQGDDDAFSLLFQRYHSFLYKYLLKLTLDEDLCSELCQEAMMKCYLNLSSYKNEAKFSTWMISIASRLYMDYLRKQQREKSSLYRTSFSGKLNTKEWNGARCFPILMNSIRAFEFLSCFDIITDIHTRRLPIC